jgi:hypothetical protein
MQLPLRQGLLGLGQEVLVGLQERAPQSGFFFCIHRSKGGKAECLRKFGHLHQGQFHMKALVFAGLVVDITLIGQVQGG